MGKINRQNMWFIVGLQALLATIYAKLRKILYRLETLFFQRFAYGTKSIDRSLQYPFSSDNARTLSA
jgi:hypothetical protein